MNRAQEIDNYIYKVIVPKYAEFDAAHKEEHAQAVIDQAMKLLDEMPEWVESQKDIDKGWLVPVDREILKMAAACHDLGLINGRGGYLKLWIPWSDNAANLNALQDIIADDEAVRTEVERAFGQIICNYERE